MKIQISKNFFNKPTNDYKMPKLIRTKTWEELNNHLDRLKTEIYTANKKLGFLESKIIHKTIKGVIMFRVIRVKKLHNIKKQVQFLEGQVQELIEKNDFLIKDMQNWEAKNKQLFHEIVELRKSKSVLESENKRHKQHLLSAENALIEKDEKLKRYTEVMSGIKKLIFKYSGKGKK